MGARWIFCKVQDEGTGDDALLLRSGGVAKFRWCIPWSKKVCNRDSEEVQNDGLQGYCHTHGIKLEATM